MLQAVAEFKRSERFGRLRGGSLTRQELVIRMLFSCRFKHDCGQHIKMTDSSLRFTEAHVDLMLYEARQRRIYSPNGETQARSVEESSLNTYKTDLRRFGDWLAHRKYVRDNPSAHLRNVPAKTPQAKRKPINKNQASLLIKIATETHPRDGMTAMLMLLTGMRESEIVGLRWGMINWESDVIVFPRPKQKDAEHTAFITPQLREGLEKWRAFFEERHGEIQDDWFVVPALAHREDRPGFLGMNPDWPMVPTNKQQNIGSKRVKGWLKAVGEKNLHGRASHTLRRTAANLLLASGATMREVQEFLGHKSIRETELYLDIDVARDGLRRHMQNSFHV